MGAERAGRLLRVLVAGGPDRPRGRAPRRDRVRRAARRPGRGARPRASRREAEVRLAELDPRPPPEARARADRRPHDLDQATRDLDIARARIRTAKADGRALRGAAPQVAHPRPHRGHRHRPQGRRRRDRRVRRRSRSPWPTSSRLRVEGEADEADAGALALDAAVRITADGYPGQSWQGRVEEIADSVTLRRLKPQDPSRPTDTRILAVKVAFAEKSPLKLGTTVELRIQPAE